MVSQTEPCDSQQSPGFPFCNDCEMLMESQFLRASNKFSLTQLELTGRTL